MVICHANLTCRKDFNSRFIPVCVRPAMEYFGDRGGPEHAVVS